MLVSSVTPSTKPSRQRMVYLVALTQPHPEAGAAPVIVFRRGYGYCLFAEQPMAVASQHFRNMWLERQRLARPGVVVSRVPPDTYESTYSTLSRALREFVSTYKHRVELLNRIHEASKRVDGDACGSYSYEAANVWTTVTVRLWRSSASIA